MSGSEPGEMAPESSKAVVLPKFDMHIYTSELTLEELKTTINEYCIPMDLHPRLPPPVMTMDRLPSRYIRLYVKQLEEGRVAGPVLFLFSCYRRAILDAMPWRHGDIMMTFQTTMTKVKLLLRYDIKDRDMNVIDMDTFLKLPTWTGTVVSRGDPIPEEQCSKPLVTPPLLVRAKFSDLTVAQKNLEKLDAKIAAAREKKEQQNLVKAKAKRAGAGGGEAGPEVGKKPAAAAAPEIAKDTPRAEKMIVDLSGKTCTSTPPVESSHHGNEDESVANRYVPDWELRNDLCVCTFRAFKELISHLATPVEDEFLRSLSNAEVISRAYQTLGQSVVAQGELLKKHEQLNRDYVDLQNRNDAQLEELDRLRSGLWRMNQENEDLNQRLTLLDSAYSECLPREKELLDRVKDLERERDEWRETALNQVEKIRSLEKDLKPRTQQLAKADRKKLVHEFLPVVVKRLHASVEYQKSLAAPAKHRELFTMSYPYVQKDADSCDLPMNELLAVYLDVPPPPVTEGPTSGTAVEDAAQQPLASALKISTDIPFGATT
ncbi:hypothetical protein Tco_1417678 [Tanacetum coccineum]